MDVTSYFLISLALFQSSGLQKKTVCTGTKMLFSSSFSANKTENPQNFE